MSLTLCLTHNCNLRCAYCYAGRKRKVAMSRETMRRALEWAVDYHSRSIPSKKFVLGFFGGEPLVEWDLLQKADALAERLCGEIGLELRRTVTTNCTLLSKSRADWLMERHYTLGLSVDGTPERHNQYRCYADGAGSYGDVEQAVRLVAAYREPTPSFICVVRPDTLESLPESVRHLSALADFPIHLNPDFTAQWRRSDCEPFRRAYAEVADYCQGEWLRGHVVLPSWLDAKIKTLLLGGYRVCDRCAPVKRELAVAPSGNLYPCPNLVGDDDRADIRLGDVFNGIDEAAYGRLRAHCGCATPACRQCPVAARCQNWCGCVNYFSTGRTDMVSPFVCFYEKTTIELADGMAETLLARKCGAFLAHYGDFIRRADPALARSYLKGNNQ